MNSKLFKARKIASIVLAICTAVFFGALALACVYNTFVAATNNSLYYDYHYDYYYGSYYFYKFRPVFLIFSLLKYASYLVIIIPFAVMSIPLFFHKKVRWSAIAISFIICFVSVLAFSYLPHPSNLEYYPRYYILQLFSISIYFLRVAAVFALLLICLILKKYTYNLIGKIIKIVFDVIFVWAFLVLLRATILPVASNILEFVKYCTDYYRPTFGNFLYVVCVPTLILFNIFFVTVLPVGIALFKLTMDIIPVAPCKKEAVEEKVFIKPSRIRNDVALLEKYKSLLDNGTINQEEFDAKKKEILGL